MHDSAHVCANAITTESSQPLYTGQVLTSGGYSREVLL